MNVRTKSSESLGSPPRTQNQDSMTSWTDALPVCHLSGVGFATNQIYREDGKRQEDHEFEDRSFHFRLNNDCFLYGVFDGHNSSNVSNFAAQRLPAELLFDQLDGITDCETIKDILSQAFLAVEKSYFEQMDKALAEKTTLLLDGTYNTFQLSPSDVTNKLQALEAQIAGGTTAVIALVLNNKLYVANVGDTRALIVKIDENGVLKVRQISDDHTISNDIELDRLAELGLDVEMLQQQRRIGTSDNTRCIGDYHVKGGRADIEYLRDAKSDPVIAVPAVYGGIPIDGSCLFLMIMSDGLYHAVQDATGFEAVNAEIAAMVAEEFNQQATLNGVAQAVVDRVVRKHNDTYLLGVQEGKQICQKCGDITLLVRQFNCQLPNAISSPTGGGRYYPVSVPYYAARSTANPSVVIPSTKPWFSSNQRQSSNDHVSPPPLSESTTPQPTTPQPSTPTNLADQSQGVVLSNMSTESTQSSSGDTRLFSRKKYECKLELDESGKIEAYVDFSEFYDTINKLPESQRNEVLDGLMPKIDYSIMEVDTPIEDRKEIFSSTNDATESNS